MTIRVRAPWFAIERFAIERFAIERFAIGALSLLGSACSQQYAVSINDQPIYDPRPNATAYRFQDAGLQACVNIALQRPNVTIDDLTVLACPGWEIAAIEGIDAMEGLQFIDISNNGITSLAPIEGLERLSSVTASNNRITDIAPLISKATLTAAVLTGNDGIPCAQLDALQEKLGNNLQRPQTCSE